MNESPTHIDLFSGIGGFALAAKWAGFRTIAFCERDKWCQKVLAQNFNAKSESRQSGKPTQSKGRKDSSGRGQETGIPIIEDIHNFRGGDFAGATLLTGGFPCQPFSVAGKRAGKEDDRFLWPEMLRVISESKPAWIIGENVAGIINMELDRVLSDVETLGYEVQPLVIPACAVDAHHRRDRVWIVAHSRCEYGKRTQECGESQGQVPSSQDAVVLERSNCADAKEFMADTKGKGWTRTNTEGNVFADGCITQCGQDVADTQCGGQSGPWESKQPINPTENQTRQTDPIINDCQRWKDENEWFAESGMGRVAHGIPHRVDRLKGLGNAIVPQVAYQLIKTIRQLL